MTNHITVRVTNARKHTKKDEKQKENILKDKIISTYGFHKSLEHFLRIRQTTDVSTKGSHTS